MNKAKLIKIRWNLGSFTASIFIKILKEMVVLIFGDQCFHSSLIPVSCIDYSIFSILSLHKGNFPINRRKISKDQ